MAVDIDFRAALVAWAPLVAVVGAKVVENGIVEGQTPPYVVFTTDDQPHQTLGGDDAGGITTIQVECWSTSALLAAALSKHVKDALKASPVAVAACATVLSELTGFDPDLGLDAAILSIEWWR